MLSRDNLLQMRLESRSRRSAGGIVSEPAPTNGAPAVQTGGIQPAVSRGLPPPPTREAEASNVVGRIAPAPEAKSSPSIFNPMAEESAVPKIARTVLETGTVRKTRGAPPSFNLFTEPSAPAETEPAESSGVLRQTLGDTGISLARGIIGIPEDVVGLGDIVTGGATGKGAEVLGIDFRGAKDVLGNLFSPEYKEAQRNVAQAEGLLPRAKAALSNPRTIVQNVVESAPSMLAGAVGGAKVRAGITGIRSAIPALRGIIPRVSKVGVGAVGEALVSAGQTAEQARQEQDTGMLTAKQAAVAAGSGALTGIIGYMGGKIGSRLGFNDVDALAAGIKTGNRAAVHSRLTRIFAGAIQEGPIGELPQSAQEQMAQNIATGRPLTEGVAEAAAEGALAGVVMGAAGGAAGMPEARPLEAPQKTDANASSVPAAAPGVVVPTAAGQGATLITPDVPDVSAASEPTAQAPAAAPQPELPPAPVVETPPPAEGAQGQPAAAPANLEAPAEPAQSPAPPEDAQAARNHQNYLLYRQAGRTDEQAVALVLEDLASESQPAPAASAPTSTQEGVAPDRPAPDSPSGSPVEGARPPAPTVTPTAPAEPAVIAKALGIRYDGVQEGGDEPVQFTDTAEDSPAKGATFYVPAGATQDAVASKLAEVRERFRKAAEPSAKPPEDMTQDELDQYHHPPIPVSEAATMAKAGKLVVYHGTNSDPFPRFSIRSIGTAADAGTSGEAGYFGRGIYLSVDKGQSISYARSMSDPELGNEYLAETAVTLRHPYIIDQSEASRENRPDTKALRKAGYDGIIVQSAGNATEIVVFNPRSLGELKWTRLPDVDSVTGEITRRPQPSTPPSAPAATVPPKPSPAAREAVSGPDAATTTAANPDTAAGTTAESERGPEQSSSPGASEAGAGAAVAPNPEPAILQKKQRKRPDKVDDNLDAWRKEVRGAGIRPPKTISYEDFGGRLPPGVVRRNGKIGWDDALQMALNRGLITQDEATDPNTLHRLLTGSNVKESEEAHYARQAPSDTAEDKVAYAKHQPAEDVKVSDVPDQALVYRNGEWYMVSTTPDGVEMKDGATEIFGFEQSVTAKGYLVPGEKGYDLALQQYREQEAKKKPKKLTDSVLSELDDYEEAVKRGVRPAASQLLIEAGAIAKKDGKYRVTDDARAQLFDWRRERQSKREADGLTRDEAQEAVIQRIENGERVSQEEMDAADFSPDSDWRKRATSPAPTQRPSRVVKTVAEMGKRWAVLEDGSVRETTLDEINSEGYAQSSEALTPEQRKQAQGIVEKAAAPALSLESQTPEQVKAERKAAEAKKQREDADRMAAEGPKKGGIGTLSTRQLPGMEDELPFVEPEQKPKPTSQSPVAQDQKTLLRALDKLQDVLPQDSEIRGEIRRVYALYSKADANNPQSLRNLSSVIDRFKARIRVGNMESASPVYSNTDEALAVAESLSVPDGLSGLVLFKMLKRDIQSPRQQTLFDRAEALRQRVNDARYSYAAEASALNTGSKEAKKALATITEDTPKLVEALRELAKDQKQQIEIPLESPEQKPSSPPKPTKGVGAAAAGGAGEFVGATKPVEREAANATGLRESVAEIERKALGYEAPVPDDAEAWEKLRADAVATAARNPDAGQSLIDDLTKTPRPMTSSEVALLTHTKVARFNERNDAASETVRLSSTGTAEEREAAQNRLEISERKLEEVFRVAAIGKNMSKTMMGRALNALKMMMDDQFDLVEMENSVFAKQGGKPLSDDQKSEIAALKKRYDDAAATFDAERKRLIEQNESVNKELADAQARIAFTKTVTELLKAPEQSKSPFRKRMVSAADRLKAEALASMQARTSRMSVGVDPTVLVDMGKLGAAYLIYGVDTMAEWSSKMRAVFKDSTDDELDDAFKESQRIVAEERAKAAAEEKPETEKGPDGKERTSIKALFRQQVESGVTDLDTAIANVHAQVVFDRPGITPEQVRDEFSDYGKSRPLSRDDVDRTMADLRRQAQLVASIERVQEELAPLKSGPQRDKPSQKVRELTRKLNALMREAGISTTDAETQLANALAAKKTRMLNEISDREKALATGKRMEGKTGTPTENDAEADRIQAELDKLRSMYDEVFAPLPLTDEQRLNIAIKAAERSAQQATQDLKDAELGIFHTRKGKELPPSARLDQLRAERDAAKAEAARLRELAFPGQRAAEAKKKRIAAATKEFQRRIREKDFSTPIQQFVNLSDDPKGMEAQAQLEEVRTEFNVMKEHARWKTLSRREKLGELAGGVYDSVRNIGYSTDDSFLLNQGFLMAAAHPVEMLKIAARSLAAGNTAMSRKYGQQLIEDPLYRNGVYDRMRLAINTPHATGNYNEAGDYLFRLNLMRTMPGMAGKVVKATVDQLVQRSGNMFATAANMARTDLAKIVLNSTQQGRDIIARNGKNLTESDVRYLRDVGFSVNALTGQAKIPHAEGVARLFGAPGFIYSTALTAVGAPVLHAKSTELKKAFAVEYLRAMAMWAALYAASLLWRDPDDPDDGWEWDPRSSKWMDIPLWNGRSFTPIGPIKPQVRAVARLVSGQSKVGDEVRNLRKSGLFFATKEQKEHPVTKYGENSWTDFGGYLKTKAHPGITGGLGMLFGEDFWGNATPRWQLALGMFIPISIKQATQAVMTEAPVDAAVDMGANFFGARVNPDRESEAYIRYETSDDSEYEKKMREINKRKALREAQREPR